jgi:hypothetical protein
MSLFNLVKRTYQWRGEHYLEALAEQDIGKRKAIFSEFIKSLRKNIVVVDLINNDERKLEKILIRESIQHPKRTIYEIAEKIAGEFKAPKPLNIK